MKTNKNLFNQIFEQFQTLNEEVDEQNALGGVNLHQSSNQPSNNSDDNIKLMIHHNQNKIIMNLLLKLIKLQRPNYKY